MYTFKQWSSFHNWGFLALFIMFGWSKKKDTKRRDRRENKSSEENEFGIKIDKGPSDKQLEAELRALAGVDHLPDDDINLNEGEEDEEAELLRLIGGKPKKAAKKTAENDALSPTDVMADLTAEIDLGDEDVEVDENDPDLLGELMELTEEGDENEGIEEAEESEEESEAPQSSGENDIISMLKERIKMYKTAEAKAKENNESSRARRFNRGLKTLEDLFKKAKAGKAVSPSDIPPVIALNLKPGPPIQTEMTQNEGENEIENSTVPKDNDTSNGNDVITTLMERLKMYQIAEAKSREVGETTRARRFTRGIKTLESLIKQTKQGVEISVDDIPPVVALNLKPPPPPQPEPSQEEEQETMADNENTEEEVNMNPSEETESEEPTEEDIMQILSERIMMYQTAEEKAKEAGESTRARRFNRGIKTLNELLKKARAGGQVPPDEIPPPIALNLKPPVVVAAPEEEVPDAKFDTDTLVQSSDNSTPKPIKFMTEDDEEDLDIDNELLDEEVPTTVMEGLEQRLRIYGKLLQKSENDGNEALVQQYEKIIRIYKSAIKTFKNGGYVDVLKLPTPKGCPPIPIPFHIP